MTAAHGGWQPGDGSPTDRLTLADWRRRVAALYVEVRAHGRQTTRRSPTPTGGRCASGCSASTRSRRSRPPSAPRSGPATGRTTRPCASRVPLEAAPPPDPGAPTLALPEQRRRHARVPTASGRSALPFPAGERTPRRVLAARLRRRPVRAVPRRDERDDDVRRRALPASMRPRAPTSARTRRPASSIIDANFAYQPSCAFDPKLGLPAGPAGEPPRPRHRGRRAAGVSDGASDGSPDGIAVRRATLDDAPAIAEAQVRRLAGRLPRASVPDTRPGRLDRRAGDRAAWWRETPGRAETDAESTRSWVVRPRTGSPGLRRDRGRPATSRSGRHRTGAGEVDSPSTSRRSAIGRGFGRRLLFAADRRRPRGRAASTPLVVWVVRGQRPRPADRRFYEAAGFRPDGARHAIDFDGVVRRPRSAIGAPLRRVRTVAEPRTKVPADPGPSGPTGPRRTGRIIAAAEPRRPLTERRDRHGRWRSGLRLSLGPRRGSDERLLWSRDIRFVHSLATEVPGARALELDSGAVLIAAGGRPDRVARRRGRRRVARRGVRHGHRRQPTCPRPTAT